MTQCCLWQILTKNKNKKNVRMSSHGGTRVYGRRQDWKKSNVYVNQSCRVYIAHFKSIKSTLEFSKTFSSICIRLRKQEMAVFYFFCKIKPTKFKLWYVYTTNQRTRYMIKILWSYTVSGHCVIRTVFGIGLQFLPTLWKTMKVAPRENSEIER